MLFSPLSENIALERALAVDKVSGEPHLYHRAHWHDGKLYYKGKVLIDETENIEG